MADTQEDTSWNPRSRVDEELEYFTELALHETERWIQVVTRKKFEHPDDPRKSLENGILFCELMNGIRPGAIKKINKLPTPIAGIHCQEHLDNLNVFLDCCRLHFGLKDRHLFQPSDLEDLSNRAISESEELLRIETEKRLRNVAITIYYLGKALSESNYDGPPLDLSAFLELVSYHATAASPHSNAHKTRNSFSNKELREDFAKSPASRKLDLLDDVGPVAPPCEFRDESINEEREEDVNENDEVFHDHVITPQSEQGGVIITDIKHIHKRQESSDSGCDRSSAYGSLPSECKTPHVSEPEDGLTQHTRDNSIDSLISEGRGSSLPAEEKLDLISPTGSSTSDVFSSPRSKEGLEDDETTLVSDQPKDRSSEDLRYSATFDSMYNQRVSQQEATHGGHYNNGDSREDYEAFKNGNSHNRSSSIDSVDSKPDTRSSSSSTGDFLPPTRVRRSSATTTPHVNPLQFIRPESSNLVSTAKETMKKMEKQKEVKSKVQLEEEDWQSNLSNWKQKMRRKSAGSFQRSVDALPFTLPDEDQEAEKPKLKTFRQMMAGKESRRSMSFYPMDDDEDEAVFSTGAPEKKKNGLAGLRSKSMSYAVEDEDYGGSGDNNKYGFRTKQESKFGKNTFGGDANDEIKRSSLSDRISRYRDNMEDDVPVKKDTKTESKVERWRRSNENGDDSVSSRVSPVRTNRFSSDMSSKPSESNSVTDKPSQMPAERLNKFSSLRQSFESSSKPEPEPPVEQPKKDRRHGSVESPRPERYEQSHKPETVSKSQSNFREPQPSSHISPERSVPNFSQKPSSPAHRGSLTREKPVSDSDYNYNSYKTQDSEKVEPVEHKQVYSQVSHKQESRTWSYDQNGTVDSQSWSTQSKKEFTHSPEGSYSQSENFSEKENYVEKVLKISQKPDTYYGFGFTLHGGKETGQPITVKYVTPGSAADLCELLLGDEILRINGADVKSHYLESVMHVVEGAAKDGQLDLRIRRYYGNDTSKQDLLPDRNPEPVANHRPKLISEQHVEELHAKQYHVKEEPHAEEEDAEVEEDVIEFSHHKRPQDDVMERVQNLPVHAEPRGGYQQQSDDEDDDTPPPIPDVPPPLPNWDTFPSDAPITDLSFLDSSDLLPDSNAQTPAREEEGDVLNSKIEVLRRRSQFLGIRLEELDEYKKLLAEKERDIKRREENIWNQVEKNEQKARTQPGSHSNTKNRFSEVPVSHGGSRSSALSLEQQEEAIIASMEQAERAQLTNTPSSPYHSQSSRIDNDMKALQDMMETKREVPQQSAPSRRSMLFDMDAERRRMEEWDREQERLRQDDIPIIPEVAQRSYDKELFAKQQEAMTQKYEEDKKKSAEAEALKKEQEAKLLEKELAHQRELEAIRQRQQEERERAKREAEEQRIRDEEAARHAEEERKRMEERMKRDEEERKRLEEQEFEMKMRIRAKEIEDSERGIYPWATPPPEKPASNISPPEKPAAKFSAPEKDPGWRERNAQYLDAETERLQAELEQEQIRQREEQRILQLQEERRREEQRREEERREQQRREEQWRQEQRREEERREDDRRMRDQHDARLLKEKEEQIQAMEDKIHRESEALRYERDRLSAEKQQPSYHHPKSDYSQPRLDRQYNAGDYSSAKRQDYGYPSDKSQGYDYSSGPGQNYNYQGNHTSPQKHPDSQTDFKIEIQTDPNRKVIVERQSTDTETRFYSYSKPNTREDPAESRPKSKVPPPVSRKPVNPHAKPGAAPQERADSILRQEILESTKRPGSYLHRHTGSMDGGGFPQSTDQPSRSSWAPSSSQSVDLPVRRAPLDRSNARDQLQQRGYSPDRVNTLREASPSAAPKPQLRARGISRDEYRAMQRYSWHDEKPASEPSPSLYNPSGSSTAQQMTRKSLQNLSAVPKQKLMGGTDWLKAEEERRKSDRQRLLDSDDRWRPGHREAMRATHTNPSEHWLVEEAERRRLAQQAGQSRPSTLQTRQPMPAPVTPTPTYSYNDSPANDPVVPEQYAAQHTTPVHASPPAHAPPPTHVMEHTPQPAAAPRPARPIPDSIKQTLIERVSAPRGQAPPESDYANLPGPHHSPSQYVPGYGDRDYSQPAEYSPHPASQSPYHRSPEQHRSPEHHHSPPEQRPHYNQRGYDSYDHGQQGYDQRVPDQYNNRRQDSYDRLPTQDSAYGHRTQPEYDHRRADSYDRVPQDHYDHRGQNPAAYTSPQSGPAKPPRAPVDSSSSRAEQEMVSGHQWCSHCEQKLGHGTAMVVKTLGLYYHVQCFCCCVCRQPLGTGHTGADVRIRHNKLHCPNCYSNDEGISFMGRF